MKKVSEVNREMVPLKDNVIVPLERYAIIQTGGKQYFAIEGKTLSIEKIEGVAGDEIVFDDVLVKRLDAQNFEVGQPFLKSGVKATIVKQMRDRKIIVFKFKKRKKYRTKKGHRQAKTIVRINSFA